MHLLFSDTRYQSELQKVQKYLDEIFEMKGYDKLLQTVKNDEMCLFPVYIIGINWDIDGDKMDQISNAQMAKIALDYCCFTDRMKLFSDVWPVARTVGFQMVDFTESILDYYYYRSLTDQQKDSMRFKRDSYCVVL